MSQHIETNDLGVISQSAIAKKAESVAAQRADEEHKMGDASGHKADKPSGGAPLGVGSNGDCFALIEFSSGQRL